MLRPILSGNFFKEWIHFWTSFEFASNPPYLLDSYVEIQPIKEFGLRIGQQFTPFDRHEYFGPQEILFPEWAPVSEYFWTGRDKGVTAMGTIAGQLEYWAGLYSGTPLRQFNALPGNYVAEGRVTWSPIGPVGATEFAYILSDKPLPFRVSMTLQGYNDKIQSRDRELQPVDVPLPGDGDRRDDQGQRRRRRPLDPGPALRLLRRRAPSATPRPRRARRSRRWAPGGSSA